MIVGLSGYERSTNPLVPEYAPRITMVVHFHSVKFKQPYPIIGGAEVPDVDIKIVSDNFESTGKLVGTQDWPLRAGKANRVPYAILLLKNPHESISSLGGGLPS